MGRTSARQTWDDPVRLALAEGDIDVLELAIAKLATKEQVDALRSTMRWMTGTFVAVIISIISALAVVAFK